MIGEAPRVSKKLAKGMVNSHMMLHDTPRSPLRRRIVATYLHDALMRRTR